MAALLLGVPTGSVLAAGHPDGMSSHMTMTKLRPIQPGDQERADAILAEARKAADEYVDYKKALADGYEIFLPEIKQPVYHFTNRASARASAMHFDAARPTSLLYEKTATGYKLVGVMYTAPFRVNEQELNRRVPLSIAQWHLHSNLCVPPMAEWGNMLGPNPKFGLQGSIATEAACEAAGGRFLPHVLGWMVHVYPYEKNPAKIWAAGEHDEHGMEHETMPGGMPDGMPM